MAKKSNKTNHVLNLLSSGNDKPEEEETPKASQAEPPVDPNRANSVSVVQNTDEKEQLSDSIKNFLEEELAQELGNSAGEIEMPDMNLDEAVEELNAPAPEASEPVSAPATPVVEPTATPATPVVEPTATPATPVVEPATAPATPVVESATPVVNSAPAAQPANTQQSDPTKIVSKDQIDLTKKFAYVNVMEILVKERASEYMEKFGVCKCPRCVADVQAVSLSNLPPVYVVVNENAVSPLINFYRQKYAGELTVEITKACIQIDKVPHHFRD